FELYALLWNALSAAGRVNVDKLPVWATDDAQSYLTLVLSGHCHALRSHRSLCLSDDREIARAIRDVCDTDGNAQEKSHIDRFSLQHSAWLASGPLHRWLRALARELCGLPTHIGGSTGGGKDVQVLLQGLRKAASFHEFRQHLQLAFVSCADSPSDFRGLV